MPRGTFIPFEDPIHFFGRPRAFTIECPFCGRLLFIGKGERDGRCFNRVTSVVRCPENRERDTGRHRAGQQVGCGRRFLVGLVAYPIRPGGRTQTPPDQIPTAEQAAQLRAWAMAKFQPAKPYGEPLNQIEPPFDPDDLTRDRS